MSIKVKVNMKVNMKVNRVDVYLFRSNCIR